MGSRAVQFEPQGNKPIQVVPYECLDLVVGSASIKKSQKLQLQTQVVRGVLEFLRNLHAAAAIDLHQMKGGVTHKEPLSRGKRDRTMRIPGPRFIT